MINFSGLSGRGGGAWELKPVPFLFSRTVFFGAIEEKRDEKTVVKDRVLGERKPGNNCEMKKK